LLFSRAGSEQRIGVYCGIFQLFATSVDGLAGFFFALPNGRQEVRD